jgi:hypothetical protein
VTAAAGSVAADLRAAADLLETEGASFPPHPLLAKPAVLSAIGRIQMHSQEHIPTREMANMLRRLADAYEKRS